MKTLRLAFSRIFTYFLENKLICVLYFIGIVASVLMMIFYYGNTLTYKTGALDDDISYKLYTIDFKEPVEITPQTLEKLKTFEQSYEIQDIRLTAILNMDGNDTLDFKNETPISYYYMYESGGGEKCIIVESYLNNNNDVMYNPKANIFTDEQMNQNVTVAPKGKTGSVKILGEEFKIIRNETVASYNIPIEKYYSKNIRTSLITICVSERFSKNMVFRYGDFLNNLFSSEYPNTEMEIDLPDSFYGTEDAANQAGFAIIILVFMASIISFMFLLKYLMDANRRENSIFMMVGAKRKRIIVLNFLENIILTIFGIIIAIALHVLLYDSLFSKINLYENIVYTMWDYIIITLLALVVSLIVQIPFVFSYWYKDIRALKEESK